MYLKKKKIAAYIFSSFFLETPAKKNPSSSLCL